MKNKKVIFVFSGLITNSDKKILLVKRKEKELTQAHNKWELPGGKLDFGETIEEALKREIYEETGYQVTTIKMLPKTNLFFYGTTQSLISTLLFSVLYAG